LIFILFLKDEKIKRKFNMNYVFIIEVFYKFNIEIFPKTQFILILDQILYFKGLTINYAKAKKIYQKVYSLVETDFFFSEV